MSPLRVTVNVAVLVPALPSVTVTSSIDSDEPAAIVVSSDDALLPGLASSLGLATVAALVIVPVLALVACTVTVCVAPLAIEPSAHVTLPPLGAPQVPTDGVIVPIVTPVPLGRVSSTPTAAAASGPLLWIVSV